MAQFVVEVIDQQLMYQIHDWIMTSDDPGIRHRGLVQPGFAARTRPETSLVTEDAGRR